MTNSHIPTRPNFTATYATENLPKMHCGGWWVLYPAI